MSGADTSHSDYVGGLFHSHYDWLCSRLHRHLDSRAHAEDIAADTFVQLLSSPGVVPIRQPRALLTTIAQRLMYQLWRRRDLERAYLDALDNDEACTAPSPEDLAHMLEALQALDQLLDGLPAKVKATFLLSQLNGLTYPEIAAELGISQRSVSDYMARALNRCLQFAAGHEVHFDRAGFGPVRVSSAGATAWIDGLLQVRDRPLAEVIDALRPYHRGVLRLDPSVAGLRVSGLYRLDNPQQILDTLARTLPIHITRRTGLWVTVNAA